MSYVENFWSKVEKTDSCWNWIGSISKSGYGKFTLNQKPSYAHRASYELIKGKIPDGLQIDHLCRNRKCVNPEHLEVVTQQENKKRGLAGFITGLKQRAKTHCPQGHEYSKENTYFSKHKKGNKRHCRICKQISYHTRKLKMEIIN